MAAFPPPLLQKKLSDLRHVLRRHIQAPSALFDALRTGFPMHAMNPHGTKDFFCQIIAQISAADTTNDGSQHIGIHAVVLKLLAWRPFYAGFQEAFHPLLLGDGRCLIIDHTAGHRQKMPQCQLRLPQDRERTGLILQKFYNAVFQAELPLVNQEPHSQSRQTFAYGIGRMPQVPSIGRKTAFTDDLSVPQDHAGMHMHIRILSEPIPKGLQIGAGHAFLFRYCAFQTRTLWKILR